MEAQVLLDEGRYVGQIIPVFCGGDGDDDSPGPDPDNSGDNEPPDNDDYGEESEP